MIEFVEPELTVEVIRKNLRTAVVLPLPSAPSFRLLIAVLQGAATIAELDRAIFAEEVAKEEWNGRRLIELQKRITDSEKRQEEVTALMLQMHQIDNQPITIEEEPIMPNAPKPVSAKQAAYFEAKLEGIKKMTGLEVTPLSLDWPKEIGGINALNEGQRAAAEYDFEQAKVKDVAKWATKTLADYVRARQYAAALDAQAYRRKHAEMKPS